MLRCVLEAYTTIAIFKQKKRRILIFTLSKELIQKVIQIIGVLLPENIQFLYFTLNSKDLNILLCFRTWPV